jgi:hypothetical protein
MKNHARRLTAMNTNALDDNLIGQRGLSHGAVPFSEGEGRLGARFHRRVTLGLGRLGKVRIIPAPPTSAAAFHLVRPRREAATCTGEVDTVLRPIRKITVSYQL